MGKQHMFTLCQMAAHILVKSFCTLSFQKIYNVNKTHQLKPGKATDIWLVVEPHYIPVYSLLQLGFMSCQWPVL